MNQRVAFFDVDGTLVRKRTMFDFQEYYWRATLSGPEATWEIEQFNEQFELYAEHLPREEVNRSYYRTYRGRSTATVRACVEGWYAQLLDDPAAWQVESAWQALASHRDAGHLVALVSGSFVEILAPLARQLTVDAVLATRLVSVDGVYTGEIDGPTMIGDGKLLTLREFLAQQRIDAQDCFAYGDHPSDIPMLNAVGHPIVVGDDRELEAHARARRWRRLEA